MVVTKLSSLSRFFLVSFNTLLNFTHSTLLLLSFMTEWHIHQQSTKQTILQHHHTCINYLRGTS